jgi:type I restriction enzyme M protein
VPKSDIVANGYDLSVNRYRQMEYDEVQTDPPKKLLAELETLVHRIINK